MPFAVNKELNSPDDDDEQYHLQPSPNSDSNENNNLNNNNNTGNTSKPMHITDTQPGGAPAVGDAGTAPASAAAVAAAAVAAAAAGTGNKVASGDNSCLQSSLELMQQRFQEMVDLILSKLDEMNDQIEGLEKILMETVQQSGTQQSDKPEHQR